VPSDFLMVAQRRWKLRSTTMQRQLSPLTPFEPPATPQGTSLWFESLLRRSQSVVVRAPAYKWLLVGVLFLVASINCADRNAVTALFSLLRSDPGMSDPERAASHLVGAPSLLVFAWSESLLIVFGCALLFFVFRGLSQANTHPLRSGLVDSERRGTAFGFLITLAALSGGLGVQVTGYLKPDFGLGMIFAAISGMVILTVLLLAGWYLMFLDRDCKRQTLQSQVPS